MSATLFTLIGLVVGFVIGGIAGASLFHRISITRAKSGKEAQDKYKAYQRLLDAETEAAKTQTFLDGIRSGKIAEVLELLERQLDLSIIQIHKRAPGAETVQRTNSLKTLQILHEYRVRHPRKTEAKFDCDEDDSGWQETQEKVGNILNEASIV